MKNRGPAILTGLILLLAGVQGFAQTPRSGGTAAPSAQLAQQLQQLGSERTALQTDNARLKKELDAMRAERDKLKTAQQGISSREQAFAAAAARGAQERSTAQSELEQQKSRMAELVAKFRETAQTLKDVETDRTAKAQQLATRDREFKACVDNNLALYKLNGEVLDRFEHDGLLSHLARREPFTQIKRTQLENLVDEYKQQANE